MKTRKTDGLFSDKKLLNKIANEYNSLFDYSLATVNVPAVLVRIDELYAQLLTRDLKDCEAKLKKYPDGEDAGEMKNMISILNHLIKVRKFDRDDLQKLRNLEFDCTYHINDYRKFRVEAKSYNQFLYSYLFALRDEVTLEDSGLLVQTKPNQKRFIKPFSMSIEMPTCAYNIKKILAELDEHTTSSELFAMFAKVIKEFNHPQMELGDKFGPKPKFIEDYCRDNKKIIASLHFNDVIVGKVKLPEYEKPANALRK